MESIDLFSKSELLNINYDKIDYPTIQSNDSSSIKDNNFYNIISFNENDYFDKSLNSKNFSKNINSENKNIFFDEFKSEKEINPKKNDINEINKSNELELKRQLRLKRNRFFAKTSRMRKNEYIQNIIIEYNKLKIKYKKLMDIVKKCPKCNQINSQIEGENEFIYESNKKILKEELRISNKKKFLFTIAIAIISIINICGLPLNILNYSKTFGKKEKEYLRNLNSNYDQNYTLDEAQNLLLNKLNSLNGNDEGLYIHFAEYYSLIKESEKYINENVIPFGQNYLKEELNKNIQIFKENEITKEQLTKEFAIKCVKCIVEMDKKSIKMGGTEFTFYFAPRYLSKYFENKNKDGIFPNLSINKEKGKIASKIFAVKCKLLAYCINDIFSEKLQNI